MNLSELTRCEALVLGSGIESMACALTQAQRGRRTLVVTPFTCLHAEMDLTGDLRCPTLPEPWQGRLFPLDVMDEGGLLHPDRLKRHGEMLMAQAGVELLYACQVLAVQQGVATVAHKSGLYAIRCGEVFDCRELALTGADCFCLHVMDGGALRQLQVPTEHAGATPAEQVARYEDALDALPPGATPARSGTAASCQAGLPLAAALRRGVEHRPDALAREPWAEAQAGLNPFYPQAAEACVPVPQEDDWDVLVVGGGTAGAVAALYAARQGLRTCVIDMNGMLGGTATVGGVSTYWFGRREGATREIDRLVDECYTRWQLPRKPGLWCNDDVFLPDIKAHALLKACLAAGAEVRLGCIACAVQRNGQRVQGVYYAWGDRPRLSRAGMILDCTGDGDVCVLAGAAFTYGNRQDGMTYWGSLAQYTAPDTYRNNFSTMVHVGDPLDYTRFILQGRTLGGALYDHGRYVATRETRHVRGLTTVTLEDIVAMRPVEDPLYVCYSNYDPKGRLTAEMCYFGLLPPNQEIPVPRGAVIPVTPDGRPLEGLLVGGKAISCTHDALPGLRMQPDLQRQGLALAALAGCALRQELPAWQAQGVAETIRGLGGDLSLPEPPEEASLADVIASLRGDEPWEWLEDSVVTVTRQVPAVVRIMMAPAGEALPLLRARYAGAEDPLRLTLARLMLWHRADDGAAAVVEAAWTHLAHTDGLPRREGSLNYGQLLPDHGLMPEVVYLLNSLSRAPGVDVLPLMQEVLRRLESTQRDWHDLRAGIYCYGECFAWLAVRRRDHSLLPLIRRVLALPELCTEPGDTLLRERFHMLRISLYHALHVLGDDAGTAALKDYLQEKRRPLAYAAQLLLAKDK